jgi:streptogramin lyase
VKAVDNAGNVAVEKFTLRVHHATPVSLGPGTVNPITGEFSLTATDVSVSAPGSSLTVSRSYRSRHLTAGSEGPLGPQWSLSVGGQESLTKLATGSVTLTAANGGQTTFASKEGGGFNPPPGDANLSLSEVKNGKGEVTEYVLKNASDVATTRFTSPSGSSSGPWKPTKQEGPLESQTVRYIYQTVEGITEPKYALAPEPAGLSFSCIAKLEKSEKLEKGCRALEFKYSEKTEESIGESEKEWGEYKGRLKEVLLIAYNPSIKGMEEPAVAQYSYDRQGRLRAEWNPQLEKPLKMVYGYDSEGHVTALTPPGQESWAFIYGEISGDPSTGRLLKVTQAPVSAELWDGEAPTNTEAPKISGTPLVGVRLAASSGKWSNSPVVYSYQWEDCSEGGVVCVPIAGATNANYTPTSSETGHVLLVEVFATNGGGTVMAYSATVTVGVEVTEYLLKNKGYPQGIAVGPDGNVWVAGDESDVVGKVTPSGEVTEYKLASPFECPAYITAAPAKENDLWFTDGCDHQIGKITTSGSTTAYSLASGVGLQGIVAGPDGNLWFAMEGVSKIGKITTSGTITEYALPSYSEPKGIVAGPDGNLWFTEYGTSKIGKITTSGTITEYALPSGSKPWYIAAGPEKENTLWFTEYGTSKIGKITTSGVITEYALPSDSNPEGIATGPEKEDALWFTDNLTNKIGKITASGTITEYSSNPGSEPLEITAGPEKEKALWFTSALNRHIFKLNPSPTSVEGELHAPSPGWTVEYHVPVSGAGTDAPNLNKEEVEKWGQKDYPVEGMAIFPPNKTQGWPASTYEGAVIDYLDEDDRTVNTSSPTGGVSTTEYNSYNDVVRTLSPDNRTAALKESCESKEKCKSAEVSKLLDSESTYEEKGSEPGTELLSGLGPQHTIKLANGTQVEARSHTTYSYNEGAPSEGGPYHLVTKTTQGAQYSGGEADARTVTTSYSGQGNLGWKLRKPTSVTTSPNGLKFTHTIVYEESTGSVKETSTPGATSGQITEYPFGGGLGAGPGGVAVGPDGNLWIGEEEADRIGKVTPSGRITEYKVENLLLVRGILPRPRRKKMPCGSQMHVAIR